MATAPATEGLGLLRAPFPPNQISKLPKETRKQADERKAGNNIEWKCAICGGMHHKNATHLDYVGHAALTDRLLDVDPAWSWEPAAYTPEGLPAFDRTNGLWIKLTVLGVTRLGYGAADGKQGGDAVKEIIGDALRNAAMRFGAALDLWHKGDLHGDNDDEAEADSVANVARPNLATAEKINDAQWAQLITLMGAKKVSAAQFCKRYGIADVKQLPAETFKEAVDALNAVVLAATPKAGAVTNAQYSEELADEIPY